MSSQSPHGPLTPIEQATVEISRLEGRVERLRAEMESLRNPPGMQPSGIDTSTERIRKLCAQQEDYLPTYYVSALLDERDAWRANYWQRMEQLAHSAEGNAK